MPAPRLEAQHRHGASLQVPSPRITAAARISRADPTVTAVQTALDCILSMPPDKIHHLADTVSSFSTGFPEKSFHLGIPVSTAAPFKGLG